MHPQAFFSRQILFFVRSFSIEIQGCRVDAITKPGRGRSIIEDVTEMPAAAFASHLCTFHEETPIGVQFHVPGIKYVGEARPA